VILTLTIIRALVLLFNWLNRLQLDPWARSVAFWVVIAIYADLEYAFSILWMDLVVEPTHHSETSLELAVIAKADDRLLLLEETAGIKNTLS